MAGVALGDIHAVVASRARHFQISTFSLRGRRGAWRHPPSLGMAGVALGDMDLRLAWQEWHLWHWAGSGGVLGRR